MKEVLLEINLLYNKMNEVNSENEKEMGNTDDIPFAKILYAITQSLSREDLFEIGNEELINHIRRVQLIEG